MTSGTWETGSIKRTAAVVVTFNRLEMLKQCLEHLEKQTLPCDVLVVNNASTDGTGAWLETCLPEHPRVLACSLSENTGGAGGFNCGMRWAAEAGYDYVWIMDDDCLPEPDALEQLLEADRALAGDYGWLSSKCLWTDGELCPMNLQRVSPYRDAEIDANAKGLFPAQMASFVSLFLRRETILKYGLPIKEFFIWSDDWEYTRRISRSEKCYGAMDSTVVHAMKGKTVANIASDSMDRMGRYNYFYRNDVYLYRREGLTGWLWLIAKVGWHCVQILFRPASNKMQRLGIVLRGFCRGIRFHPEIESVGIR